MLSLIRNLLTENKQQNDHILEITKAAYEAELKSMELQINPHFLFNTIDSINWTAIRENCIDVSEQLNRLSYILRYTVYNMNQVVSVRDEIDWFIQYLELQKIRFHNSFSYFVSAPENVFREDAVTNGDERDALLANAPGEKDGMYVVPRTFA